MLSGLTSTPGFVSPAQWFNFYVGLYLSFDSRVKNEGQRVELVKNPKDRLPFQEIDGQARRPLTAHRLLGQNPMAMYPTRSCQALANTNSTPHAVGKANLGRLAR
ncbi:hypothetical protein Q9233_016279 [Columba guinea]|nr:hypothetical protein Q9233_016279 [Columba guinea]